jgi:hypothetical protein
MTTGSAADAQIEAAAARLRTLKAELGQAYWDNDEVRALQQQLRRQIGGYGAWGEDKLPMHQRARRAARLESELAALLWPGRSDN